MTARTDRTRPVAARVGLLVLVLAAVSGCASTGTNPAAAKPVVDPPTEIRNAMAAGDQAMLRGAHQAALVEYARVLTLDPKHAAAHTRIATIHAAQGSTAKATQAYRAALAAQADHADALQGLGLLLLRERKTAEAGPLLERAVQKNPKLWQAHNGLGMLADRGRDFARAQAHYKAALTLRPGNSMLLNNMGYSRYLAGNLNEAQRWFEQAIAADRRNDKAWSNLGLVHTRGGNYGAAVDALTHAMPAPEAYNNIGYLCMLAGRNAEAESFFVKAIELSPSYYTAAQENLLRVRTHPRTPVTRTP